MRERLTTLALALGALAVFGTLFVRTGVPGRREARAPTTVEAHGNGLLGLATWLGEEGIRTVSLRERFGVLATRKDLAARGNLLVVTLPAATVYRPGEAVALEAWVRAGNTLLVLAALSDRPDWAREQAGLLSDLPLLTGLYTADTEHESEPRSARNRADFRSGEGVASLEKKAADLVELARPQHNALVPNRPHAYLDGVGRAVALSDYPPSPSVLNVPHDGFVLALAHADEGRQGVLWVRSLGAGTVIVSGFASLFTNQALGLADNARLFANIVAAELAPGAAVIFDDEHQGLSKIYDPEKFYADGRLYATMAIIAAVWFIWVLGGTQLQAPVVRAPAPREAQLVRDTGLYLARVLRPAAAARRMIEQFFMGLATPAGGAPGGDEAWRRLEEHPRVASADIAQLRSWHAQASAGRSVPLVALRNLIVRIERQVTA